MPGWDAALVEVGEGSDVPADAAAPALLAALCDALLGIAL